MVVVERAVVDLYRKESGRAGYRNRDECIGRQVNCSGLYWSSPM